MTDRNVTPCPTCPFTIRGGLPNHIVANILREHRDRLPEHLQSMPKWIGTDQIFSDL